MPEVVRVYSVLPVLGHPRDSKRIRMLQDAGFVVEAAAFDRGQHAARLPDCSVENLGRISHGRYVLRILKLPTVFPILRRGIRRNQIVYASGPDMALMALLSGIGLQRPVILEVGDIRRIQVAAGFPGVVVRLLERWLIARCALLVVTARGFIDEYYAKRLKSRTPALVIENKLEPAVGREVQAMADGSVAPMRGPPIRIGYFGVLRCEWSLQVLETLALKYPGRFSIVLAGTPMFEADVKRRTQEISNVEYVGTYESPGDLPALYRSIDLTWAGYPGPERTDKDWWLAQAICRSNRFYESCRYGTPLVSVEGSGDAIEVRKLDIGIVLDDQGVDAVVDALTGIRHSDLARWGQNIRQLPREVFEYTTEGDDLKRAIQTAIGPTYPRNHEAA